MSRDALVQEVAVRGSAVGVDRAGGVVGVGIRRRGLESVAVAAGIRRVGGRAPEARASPPLGVIVRVAFRFTPPAEPVITAFVVLATTFVVTGKEALVAPWAIVTLAGTTAAGLLLESVTTRPPAGAGLVNVAVPVEGDRPRRSRG